MTVTVTVANSVPAGSLGAAFSSFSASGLFTLTGVEDTLTAHAGGTQAAALALSSTKNYHRISVCATAADSVALPPATVGQTHFVRNDGAASCQVFGTTPDTIDGVATATGIALPAGVGRWFVCTTAAKWYTDEAATTTGSGANVLATAPTLNQPNIVGSATNDAAAAGSVGEFVSAAYSSVSLPTSGQYGDLASISLTAGDWDVSLGAQITANGATVTQNNIGINTTTGNVGGMTTGYNFVQIPNATAAADSSGFIPGYRLSLAVTTTVYAKAYSTYSVAVPNAQGVLSARRVR